MNFVEQQSFWAMGANKFKRIGVLGGMGPEATLSLFELIIKATPAKRDQDHIPLMINNNPTVPDRTRHLLYNEQSPLPDLIKGAKILEQSGVNFIVVPCNTAHYYLPQLQSHLSIPILNMPDLVSKYVAKEATNRTLYPQDGSLYVGVLATTGTIFTKLYQNYLKNYGLTALLLEPEQQEGLVMEAVYGKEGIKAGCHTKPAKLLKEAADLLIKQGAKFIISGCTEVALVLTQEMVEVPLINSLEVLAQEAVKIAMEGQNE